MSTITNIEEISRSNISTLVSVDFAGVVNYSIDTTVDLLKISSIRASYTTGNITTYVPNYSVLQERSTISAMKDFFVKSSDANVSTSIGVMKSSTTLSQKLSTLIGISTNCFALTLEDVLKVTNGYMDTENANKSSLKGLDYDVLKNNIFAWVTKGFPESYPVYKLYFTLPENTTSLIPCSDAVPRNIPDYIDFCVGMPLQELIDSYNTMVDDITLTYSIQNKAVVINVNRKI